MFSHHDAQLQCDKTGNELPVGSKVGYRNHITNKFDVGIISARLQVIFNLYGKWCAYKQKLY